MWFRGEIVGIDLEGVLGVELIGFGYGLDVEDEKKKRVKAFFK